MLKRETVKILIDEPKSKEVIEYYQSYQIPNNGEYIIFFAKKGDLTIAIYSSKKANEYKLLFMGINPIKEAKIWDKEATIAPPKEKKTPSKASWLFLGEQIGSDEVGTGDFFGPICVAGAYIKESDIPRLRQLGVDDSKRLSDQDILKIGESLIKEFPYSQIALNNEKYNELIDKGLNVNEMKAKLHNKVLANLLEKYPDVKNVFVDQFAEQDKYFEYLSDEKKVIKNITFKTKGETYFPSVAVGSIIARYSFLIKMKALSQKYGKEIPFGASKKVTDFAKLFAKAWGEKELLKVIKKNFANLKDVLE